MKRPEDDDDDGMPTKSEIRVQEGERASERPTAPEPERKSLDDQPPAKEDRDSDDR
jgi:hypothetical protein